MKIRRIRTFKRLFIKNPEEKFEVTLTLHCSEKELQTVMKGFISLIPSQEG